MSRDRGAERLGFLANLSLSLSSLAASQTHLHSLLGLSSHSPVHIQNGATPPCNHVITIRPSPREDGRATGKCGRIASSLLSNCKGNVLSYVKFSLLHSITQWRMFRRGFSMSIGSVSSRQKETEDLSISPFLYPSHSGKCSLTLWVGLTKHQSIEC